MASIDKEIQVIMLRGQTGLSSYEEAVKHSLFSGTLEEWIVTFATPDNYITRTEFQKVTQAEYDALEEAGELIPNCYYLITDDDTWETIQGIIATNTELANRMDGIEEDVETLQEDVSGLDDDINTATTGLKARVSTLESDLSALSGYVSDDEDDIADLQADVGVLQQRANTPTINVCNSTSEVKEVTTDYNLPLTEGAEIYIKFATYGSASQWLYMTLNVNSTGGLPIYALGSVLTVNDNQAWYSGDIVKLVYLYDSSNDSYYWNVQENVTKHIYFGTLYTR